MRRTQTEWLQYYEKELREKNPTYSEKGIQRLARDLLEFRTTGTTEDNQLHKAQLREQRLEREKRSDPAARIATSENLCDRVAPSGDPKPCCTPEQVQKIRAIQNNTDFGKLYAKPPQDSTSSLPQKTEGINKPDSLGRRPIHWAVYEDDLPAVKRLVEKEHADLLVEDNQRNTPYSIAKREGFHKIAAYILSQLTKTS